MSALRIGLLLPFFIMAAVGVRGDEPALDQLSPAVRSLSLDGAWQLSYGPIASMDTLKQDLTAPPSDDKTISATVPGDALLDLQTAGIEKDARVGLNVYDLLKYEPYQWWYHRTFATPALRPGERAELAFDGLDTIGTIWLNGKLVGRASNMFIAHRFDVSALLRPAGGTNDLLVRIDPAALAGRDQHFPGEITNAGHYSSLELRKSAARFGWDISPRVVGGGLWQSVHLDLIGPDHIRATYWTTKVVNVPAKGECSVIVDWDFETNRINLDGMKVRVQLARNGQVAMKRDFNVQGDDTHGQKTIDGIKGLELWWPRGFGAQPLYDASVQLLDPQGNVLDEKKDRIGVRTIALLHTDTTSKEQPGYFYFTVNGQKVFIKGSNWPYLDVFPSREAKRTDEVVKLLADTNANMIRVHGGGTYGSDRFYDLCDEDGIMVWQDFMLANLRVPQTDAFRQKMTDEAAAVITRIRNHPSLAIYCGGNEVDYEYLVRDNLDPNFDTISREVLPAAIRRYDFARARNCYLPSTPYIGPEAVKTGVRALPDRHIYLFQPPYYFKDPTFTSDVIAEFASETGWDSFPNRETVNEMFDPDFVQPWTKDHKWNAEWLAKSPHTYPTDKSPGALNNVLGMMRSVFSDVPDDLDSMIQASQMGHGEALKFWIESYRIRKWDRSGILYWQFQDGWPLVNYGVVDYYDRKKLAYDYVQEAQRDVQAICGEAENGKHPIVIVNDTLKPVSGTVTVASVGGSGSLLEKKFQVRANGKATVGSIADPASAEMWQIKWKLDGGAEFHSHYLATHGPVPLAQYVAWAKQVGLRTQ